MDDEREVRSRIMRAIRGKNTRPELVVRKFLFECGFRYRVHDGRLPGKPDIVLKRYRTVVMVNGCFWHGHVGCAAGRLPKSNIKFWEEKIRRNRERDERVRKELEAAGWRVFTVWECDLRNNERRLLVLGRLAAEICGAWPKPKQQEQEYGTQEEPTQMAAESEAEY